MNGKEQQAQPTVRRATPDLLYIPLVPFVTVGVAALLIGIVASFWVGASLLALGLGLSVVIGYWATRRGDTLVVALALLVFWLPFHTTFSRLNVSPQEIATYGICLEAAVLDRRGVRHWVAELTSTIPIAARFVIVLF